MLFGRLKTNREKRTSIPSVSRTTPASGLEERKKLRALELNCFEALFYDCGGETGWVSRRGWEDLLDIPELPDEEEMDELLSREIQGVLHNERPWVNSTRKIVDLLSAEEQTNGSTTFHAPK